MLARYPDVDVVAGVELIPLEITTDVAGAQVWIDLRYAGKSPLTVMLRPGEHVIAAASGSRRGWAAGSATKAQAQLAIPMKDHAGPWNEVALRVAGWKGQMPDPKELGWVMAKVRARVALVRRGDVVEAWGRIGLAEAPHRLGGDDATAPVAEVERLVELVVDRIHTWNDRAPDPDRPLLVEDPKLRGKDGRRRELPTKWWVYASIGAAIAAGVTIIYLQDAGGDRQRVELHYP
ncbi:MAG: PEGA domain-containing protein [Deltaproteobacteria bacterium]|nr:PEGA domain-containing protein [Deltaproteobacteria bacterium]